MTRTVTRNDFLKSMASFAAVAGLPHNGLSAAVVDRRGTPPLRKRSLAGYRIVVPDQADPLERQAADVLRAHLAQVLGTTIPLTTESTHVSGRGIFVGTTRFAARRRPATPPLAAEAFAIIPIGDDLIVAGGSGRGTLHGAYGLLEFWGFRRYASDALRVPAPSQLGLPARAIIDSPVIGYRTTLYADTERGDYPAWHGLSANDRWGMFVHTFGDLVPADRYGASHPEFFSLVNGRRLPGTQLCLSNERMRDVLIANLAQRMAQKPAASHWSVSQNDNDQYCRCDRCAALDARYGGVPSGSILHFVNQVAKAFPEKTISTLAYWYSRTPPRDISAEPNVNIMLCNIESRRQAPVYQTDPAFSRDLNAWGAIARSIMIWDYNIQFTNLVSPFPNLHTIKPNIDFFVRNRTDALFMQANREVGGEFAELRAYLIAKLMWDPKADDQAIIDDFLSGYYGAAGSYIRRYIDAMRQRLSASGYALDIFGSPEGAKDAYLTAAALQEYDGIFDRAERVVADRPDLLRRVRSARLPLMYARIQIGRNEPVNSPRGLYVRKLDGTAALRPELATMLDRFTALSTADGVTRLRERSTSPADYKASYDRVIAKLAEMRDARSLGKPVRPTVTDTAGGPALDRLTDGLFGSWESWSSPDPNWVSFVGRHMEVILDLGDVVPVQTVETTFLNAQAQPDWNTLVLPEAVELSVSADGERFVSVGKVVNPHNPDPRINPGISTIPVHAFRFQPNSPTKARFVKIRAQSVLKMPSWHINAGKPAIIATDQVIVT